MPEAVKHREIIMITADVCNADPNRTHMTVVQIDGPSCKFKSFSGFTAQDIYELLTKEEE